MPAALASTAVSGTVPIVDGHMRRRNSLGEVQTRFDSTLQRGYHRSQLAFARWTRVYHGSCHFSLHGLVHRNDGVDRHSGGLILLFRPT